MLWMAVFAGVSVLCAACLLAAGMTRRSWVFENDVARVTRMGRVRVASVRAIIPLIGGVSRSIGYKSHPVRISHHPVMTGLGRACVTLYRPSGADAGTLPVYVNFHGGGFILGFPKQDDIFCRHIANHAGCVVVNADYALAPDHPFPAAILQSYDVLKWLVSRSSDLGLDTSRLAVGGSSAGGAIAAALCLLSRERADFNIRMHVVVHGCLDFAQSFEDKHILPARRQFLSARDWAFCKNLYLPDARDRNMPLASPLLAKDFRGLPRALVITAEYDVLKAEGRSYAERLRAAGVGVVYRDFPNSDHGFMYFGPKSEAIEALDLMTAEIRDALHGPDATVPIARSRPLTEAAWNPQAVK
ncbi:MAG TPA: alpha/beta hydrolase [Rhizomicrobium sp.]|nr:alpha/beta hydrolase [Rhizomicrobium sp.]